MVRRLAAISALVLAGFAGCPAAQAQGFFSFYDTSPRDVVDRLYEQGYNVHLPMIRRGEVYVVDVVSPSHRPMRLIVSARDGRVLERFATTSRRSEDQPRSARWHDDDAERYPDDSDAPHVERRTRTALGDPLAPPSRLFDRDTNFDSHPIPPAALGDDSDKPKRHAKKHLPGAKDGPDSQKSDAAVAPTDTKPPIADPLPPSKAIEIPQATSAARTDSKIAPDAKTTPQALPEPLPTSQAKAEDRPSPRVIPLTKPSSPSAKVEDAPMPVPTATQAKSEDKATPKPTPKPWPTTQAKIEEKPKTDVMPPAAPKPEASHKKLNDLPVGTLD